MFWRLNKFIGAYRLITVAGPLTLEFPLRLAIHHQRGLGRIPHGLQELRQRCFSLLREKLSYLYHEISFGAGIPLVEDISFVQNKSATKVVYFGDSLEILRNL